MSVVALSNVTLSGVDELTRFTLRMLSNDVCPAAVGLQYTGGPESDGPLGANCDGCSHVPQQTIEPMSHAQTSVPRGLVLLERMKSL